MRFGHCISHLLFLILLFCIYPSLVLFSQIKTTGIPPITNYSKNQYQGSTQNWDIVQDRRGIMYFANNDGLLMFDGTYWEKYSLPNGSIIRCFAIDSADKLYVGAFNEFGFFKPNRTGALEYHSLTSLLPDSLQDKLGEIWKIHCKGKVIYFQSFLCLLKYENDTIKMIMHDANLKFSFMVNDRIFIQHLGQGLFELINDSLYLIPDGAQFSKNEIWAMMPLKDKKILLATFTGNLFILDKETCKPWHTEADEFLQQNTIFCGIPLGSEYYAFGTIQNGLIVIDKKGTPQMHLNIANGIQNNTVLCLFIDRDHNLWLGLDNGIDFIKINSPVSYLSPNRKIGAGYTALIHQENIYLGTNQGLWVKSWSNNKNSSVESDPFALIPGTSGQVWTLTEIQGTILCGHDKGIFQIIDRKAVRIADNEGGWNFKQLPDKPDFLISGTYNGLLLFRKLKSQTNQSTWKLIGHIKGLNESCREIEMDADGSIWISHVYKGVYRVHLTPNLDSIDHLQFFNSSNGFPSDFNISVTRFKDEIVFTTEKGFYQYDSSRNKFIANKVLNQLFGSHKVDKMYLSTRGDIWYIQDQQVSVLKLNYDGSYSHESLPYNNLKGSFINGFENFYQIEESNEMLIGTEDGFIHFSPSYANYITGNLQVFIRKIMGINNTVLFHGNFYSDNKLCAYQPENQIQEILYTNNSLIFRYTTPTYTEAGEIEYRIFLDGFDKHWQNWTKSNQVTYTNLKEGEYIFKIKARNLQHIESEITEYRFIILPPWYRTWWAYLVYTSFIAFFVYYSIRAINKRIEKEKNALKEQQKQELELKEKLFAEDTLRAEKEIIRLRNDILQAENEKNTIELENKSKELATIAMQINYKNDVLQQIKEKLTHVSTKMIHEDSKIQVEKLIKTLKNELLQQEDWDKFELHFDKVHEGFLKKLKQKFPLLTPKDLKLCAYLRMNLSSKEIAPLLNISIRGVEISRYRLRRRLNILHDENLTNFLLSL